MSGEVGKGMVLDFTMASPGMSFQEDGPSGIVRHPGKILHKSIA